MGTPLLLRLSAGPLRPWGDPPPSMFHILKQDGAGLGGGDRVLGLGLPGQAATTLSAVTGARPDALGGFRICVRCVWGGCVLIHPWVTLPPAGLTSNFSEENQIL